MRNKFYFILLIIAVIIILTIILALGINFQMRKTENGKNPVFISKVLDGDTVKLKGGKAIRLLGINAPEKGQPYYKEATNRLKELVEHKNVTLERDIKNNDQYNRLLRYVFVDGIFVNLKLVREGYANVYIIEPNTKYALLLKEGENEAKEKNLGIWKGPSPGEICGKNCISISYFKWNAEGNDCENLNGEYVSFVNNCSYPCNLTGWTIKNQGNRIYKFPKFILMGGNKVRVYTGSGINTKNSLYWNNTGKSCNAVWNNKGDTLYLRNSGGELVLSYSYEGFK